MDMLVCNSIAEAREIIRSWRASAERIALVPTMGNLHEGHLALVDQAAQLADRVVVSIFVNPTQFAPGEDFSSYPRTEEQDLEKLRQAGVDLVFLPAVTEMYRPDAVTQVTVGGISDEYCGAVRPGHFAGVATVVCKLFNSIQPDLAIFGLKDYQQFVVIRAMARDLDIPVEIVGVETVREASGLALSSRNSYLTAGEKEKAALLYLALCDVRAAVLAGQLAYEEVEQQALRFLRQSGFQPDYVVICRGADLARARPGDDDLVVLVAARLGKARLIDNIRFSK